MRKNWPEEREIREGELQDGRENCCSEMTVEMKCIENEASVEDKRSR